MTPFGEVLAAEFGAGRISAGHPLAPLTTFRVGGPAEWLLEARSSEEIVKALAVAHREGVAVTILGGGSNVLISDLGIRGLVIRPRRGEIRRVDEGQVRADAAVTINGLVRWTILHAAAGLEGWAGTPGTVGGAIFGNAHFAGQLIGSLVTTVQLADAAGRVTDLSAAEMEFGYDRSRLQRTREVLLSATFRVSPGDPAALRWKARESLAFRKRTQPLDTPSAGCVFQNPQLGRDQLPAGVPYSAGALVDRAGLKGAACGGARVSPTHGNFIVNEGAATARDIGDLIERCRREVRDQFGVELQDEIVRLGQFEPYGESTVDSAQSTAREEN
jgi:UDP-N-acetylmuramate dehydrogenase